MKTLRFHLPVVDAAHPAAVLDLVTSVRGVVAALLDAPASKLEVMVASEHCALLVKEELTRSFGARTSVSV